MGDWALAGKDLGKQNERQRGKRRAKHLTNTIRYYLRFGSSEDEKIPFVLMLRVDVCCAFTQSIFLISRCTRIQKIYQHEGPWTNRHNCHDLNLKQYSNTRSGLMICCKTNRVNATANHGSKVLLSEPRISVKPLRRHSQHRNHLY